MAITVSKSALVEAVSFAKAFPMVDTNTAYNIKVYKKYITISGRSSIGQFTCKVKADCENENAEECIVDGEFLSKVVPKAPNGIVTLDFLQDGLALASGNMNSEIPYALPRYPIKKWAKVDKVPCGDVLAYMDEVAWAASISTSLAIGEDALALGDICITPVEDGLEMVATNRGALSYLKVEGEWPIETLYVPAILVPVIKKFFNTGGVSIGTVGNEIYIQDESKRISFNKTSLPFPDYRNVLNAVEHPTNTLRFDRDRFLAAVKKVTGVSDGVGIRITMDTVEVGSMLEHGKLKESIDMSNPEVNDEVIQFYVMGKYLVSAIASMEEVLYIDYFGLKKPIAVRTENRDRISVIGLLKVKAG